MNDDLHATVLGLLRDIRPEADLEGLPPDADLREELDLDSMDILSLVISISEATGIDVPEEEYHHLGTLAGALAYLDTRREGGRRGGH